MGGYKEVDTLNKEFQKAQKNWLKMATKIDEQKQRYHRVCFEETQNNTRAKQERFIRLYGFIPTVIDVLLEHVYMNVY